MNDDMGSSIKVLYSAIINNIHNSLAITFAFTFPTFTQRF
jgi:hypothetical protein